MEGEGGRKKKEIKTEKKTCYNQVIIKTQLLKLCDNNQDSLNKKDHYEQLHSDMR